MIRAMVGIILVLLVIGFSWLFFLLFVPLAGILTGISAFFSFLFALGVFMVLPTLIIIGIVFLVFIVPIKLIQNSRK